MLALKEGMPVKVVSERLGHMRIEITLDGYAHSPHLHAAGSAAVCWGSYFMGELVVLAGGDIRRRCSALLLTSRIE